MSEEYILMTLVTHLLQKEYMEKYGRLVFHVSQKIMREATSDKFQTDLLIS